MSKLIVTSQYVNAVSQATYATPEEVAMALSGLGGPIMKMASKGSGLLSITITRADAGLKAAAATWGPDQTKEEA